METTTNYKLPQWVKADQIKMDDFNGAFGKIDTALKAAADATAEKADAATVQQTVAALQTALGSGGKTCRIGGICKGSGMIHPNMGTMLSFITTCRISSGSYAGNGKTGQSNPSSLTFDFTPVLVVIIRKDSPGTHTLFVRPNGYGPMGDTMGTITWGEKKVSWYCQNPQVAGDVQMNMSGSDYYYVGLGF